MFFFITFLYISHPKFISLAQIFSSYRHKHLILYWRIVKSIVIAQLYPKHNMQVELLVNHHI